MITIKETIEIFQSRDSNNSNDGSEMLTCTVWADDEPLKEFGGNIGADWTKTRANALAFAERMAGVTGASIRAHDEFVAKMNACEFDR